MLEQSNIKVGAQFAIDTRQNVLVESLGYKLLSL